MLKIHAKRIKHLFRIIYVFLLTILSIQKHVNTDHEKSLTVKISYRALYAKQILWNSMKFPVSSNAACKVDYSFCQYNNLLPCYEYGTKFN